MGLESATYLDDLVTTNPVAGDLVAQGDDHFRLLKSVLKATFPNLDTPRYLEQARADVASASAPDIWAATTNYVNITGTTTITDFADADFSGQVKLVRFDDALTLTHGASAINLPGGADITTAAGDHALFVAQGTTQFNCVFYMKKSGRAVIEPTNPQYTTIELGHASDTTLSRSAAGILAVEGLVVMNREPLRNTQTGTAYTLAASDTGKIVTMNNGSANTLTIDLQSNEAYLANTIVEVKQIGAGVTTIEAASGVTLNGVDGGSCSIENRYQSVALFREAEDTWIVDGAFDEVS